MDITVANTNTVTTGSHDVIVSTTCPAGYTLAINYDSPNNTNNIYRNADTTSEYRLSSTTGTIGSPVVLADNQWGFSLTNPSTNGNKFSAMPITKTDIKTTNTGQAVVDDRTPIYYGVKTDGTLASGNYIGTVIYTITPNPDCFKQLDKEFRAAYQSAGKTTMAGTDGKQYYKMQDMNQGICDAAPTPDKTKTEVPEITLIDTRDKELYTVRKLADGNCWMVDNLRLKLTANQALTSADTDISSNFTPTLSTQPPSENTTSWGSYRTASDVNKSRSYDTGNRDYGISYNLYAATAGTGTYDMTSGNAVGSICPKGWQLPLYDGNKSFHNLITITYGLTSGTEGFTNLQGAPLKFVLSGYYDDQPEEQGKRGDFWAARIATQYYANGLGFNSSTLVTQDRGIKTYGNAVRCVSRDEPENNSALTQALKDADVAHATASDGKEYYTMQSMTSSICSAVSTPSKTVTSVPEATLIDTRDNELYTVRKLADGNCWMTQNLRLVGSRTLTSADSDVSSNYTLPAAQTSAFTNSSNNNQVGAVQSSYDNGAYYSWYAATAGTGTAAMSTQGQDATSSICPKGWRLPPYSGNKSYQNLLFTTYGATNSAAGYNVLVAQPLQFVLAGYYYTSGFGYGGSRGGYWSSSVNNASYAYGLYFSSSGVNPQYSSSKYVGFSVRCVSR